MTIDLSLLPPPDVIEPLDFETIFAGRKVRLLELLPEAERTAVAAVLALESEPLTMLLQENAYEVLHLRQRINEAARALMLTSAMGNDLEHLAALYAVTRLVVDVGDPVAIPPVPPTLENDVNLRFRTQLAPEGFSTAGPVGAYRFHALSASGQVKDASVDSPRFGSVVLSAAQQALLPPGTVALACTYDAGLPTPRPGMVRICVLSVTGDGTPTPALLAEVAAVLNSDDVRPLTDEVIVTAPQIIPYTVQATLATYPGPSPQPVLEAALAAAARYTAETHRLGYDVTLSGLYAALHQPGVQRVFLDAPVTNIVCGPQQAAYCQGIELNLGGVDV